MSMVAGMSVTGGATAAQAHSLPAFFVVRAPAGVASPSPSPVAR
jgi:hypothetical protein